jgi:hypothetical protein
VDQRSVKMERDRDEIHLPAGRLLWCALMQFSLSLVSTAQPPKAAKAKKQKLITKAAKNRTTHRQDSSRLSHFESAVAVPRDK